MQPMAPRRTAPRTTPRVGGRRSCRRPAARDPPGAAAPRRPFAPRGGPRGCATPGPVPTGRRGAARHRCPGGPGANRRSWRPAATWRPPRLRGPGGGRGPTSRSRVGRWRGCRREPPATTGRRGRGGRGPAGVAAEWPAGRRSAPGRRRPSSARSAGESTRPWVRRTTCGGRGGPPHHGSRLARGVMTLSHFSCHPQPGAPQSCQREEASCRSRPNPPNPGHPAGPPRHQPLPPKALPQPKALRTPRVLPLPGRLSPRPSRCPRAPRPRPPRLRPRAPLPEALPHPLDRGAWRAVQELAVPPTRRARVPQAQEWAVPQAQEWAVPLDPAARDPVATRDRLAPAAPLVRRRGTRVCGGKPRRPPVA